MTGGLHRLAGAAVLTAPADPSGGERTAALAYTATAEAFRLAQQLTQTGEQQ